MYWYSAVREKTGNNHYIPTTMEGQVRRQLGCTISPHYVEGLSNSTESILMKINLINLEDFCLFPADSWYTDTHPIIFRLKSLWYRFGSSSSEMVTTAGMWSRAFTIRFTGSLRDDD